VLKTVLRHQEREKERVGVGVLVVWGKERRERANHFIRSLFNIIFFLTVPSKTSHCIKKNSKKFVEAGIVSINCVH